MSSSFDDLLRACKESQSWPSSLLRSQVPKSLLDQHRRRLEREKDRLFVDSDDKSHVNIWESLTEDSCFRRSQWNSIDDLEGQLDIHLLRKVKDPIIRHVFLSATHFASPLNCTYDMFLYLCTYHQIPFEFVDLLLYSFGRNGSSPRDFHHTSLFQHIDRKGSSGPTIPTLGRSGYEARVGYKLSGMEMSDTDNEWTLRRTATYHSLDLETGRSFWLTTKANDVISKRVIEVSSSRPNIPVTPQDALSNALQTHLIITSWCSEGWQFYINSIELTVRAMLTEIMAAPIPDEHTAPVSAVDWVSGQSHGEVEVLTQLPSMIRLDPSRDTRGQGRFGTEVPLLPQWAIPTHNVPVPKVADHSRKAQLEHTVKKPTGLRFFSLGDMQQLSSVGLKLKEARMVMSLNVTILKELKEYYTSFFEAPGLPQAFSEGCADSMHDFKKRMNVLERSFESECMRCDTLISQLQDGKMMASCRLIIESQSEEKKSLTKSLRDSNSRLHMLKTTQEKGMRIASPTILYIVVFLPGVLIIGFIITSIISGDKLMTLTTTTLWALLWLFLPLALVILAVLVAKAYLYMKRISSWRISFFGFLRAPLLAFLEFVLRILDRHDEFSMA